MVLYVFELAFVKRLLKPWMEHSQWFFLNLILLKPDSNVCIHITGKCEEIDNQYYSYGDYQVIHNVADFTECCRICKDDPECQNFSFGKEGTQYSNQCHKKKGGNLGSRSEFIFSAFDISSCLCWYRDLSNWYTYHVS